jgi:4,5-dihydroxyphthalate decarboxylase
METEVKTLQILLATYPNTLALKNGTVQSSLVDFDFADVEVASNAFKPLVREAKFDAGELAILTFLQAKTYGKPYVVLPAVVVGRGQHHTIAYNPEKGELKPTELNGKRVGVRSYTQTTGAWVRGILEEEYGQDVKTIDWVTFEDPHITEYNDPSFVRKVSRGKTIAQMLLDGEIDAAIVGNKIPDPRLKHLIPDHEAAAQRWAERHHGVPINHMLIVRESIATEAPEIVRELFRMFKESAAAAGDNINPNAIRFGVDKVWPSIDIMMDYAVSQRLIPRRFEKHELFNDFTASLA